MTSLLKLSPLPYGRASHFFPGASSALGASYSSHHVVLLLFVFGLFHKSDSELSEVNTRSDAVP